MRFFRDRFFFPGSWVSLCLPFLNLPKAVHLLLSSLHNWGKKSRMSLLWTSGRGEEGENDAIIREVVWVVKQGPDKGGRLQGSPAPRQMCLGVTPHPQPNESPNRCLTSRPGCHASQTHTCTHQPCKGMHTHTVQFITALGRVAPQGVRCSPCCDFDRK